MVLLVGANNIAPLRYRFQQSSTNAVHKVLALRLKQSIIPISSLIEKYTINTVSKIVANCDYLGEIYRERVYDKKRVAVIRNGIDTTVFTPEGVAFEADSQNHSPVYVGRLKKRKGLEILLKEFAVVKKHRKDVRLFIVGRALDESDLIYLKNQMKRLQSSESVQFMGALPNNHIPMFLRAAEILLFPSPTHDTQVEGLPNTILEGKPCAVPIIASDVCGIPEVIQSEKNGILVESGKIQEFAE